MQENRVPKVDADEIDVLSAREARVGALEVRRSLPQRRRRTVGAWCFADHMGPADVTEGSGLDVGPHPHVGLQTVTWLTDGQALHRDSLGNEQVIVAGELNLMTAGHGVSHSEEPTGHYRGTLQGIQLWVAQSDARRHGPAAFEHLDDLAQVALSGGTATVLVGEFHGTRSAARTEADLVGVDVRLRGPAQIALDPRFEYGAIVLEGLIEIEGRPLGPGTMAYLSPGRDETLVDARLGSRVILLGGAPLEEDILMWWNFVARSREEIADAYQSWSGNDGRFGAINSTLARVETKAPAWNIRTH